MVSLISLADKLISFGSKIRPVWLKERLFFFTLTLGLYLKRVVKIVKQVRLDVSLVHGTDKRTGEPICITLISNDPFPLFLIDKLFSQKPTIEKTGKLFVGNIPRLRTARSTDTILVKCDRFYQRFLHKKRMLVFPTMVDMVLDTTQPVEFYTDKKIISRDAYTELKRINKFNYTFKVSNEIEKIHMFYYSMYLPMIQSRHEDALLYTPSFVFFKYLKEVGYKLLLIIDDKGVPISGIYFHEKSKEMFVRYAGLLNGDISLLKKGASAAKDYYSIVYAKDKGIDKVNNGAARPFFDDGVFQYKKKWGMKVIKADGATNPEIFGLFIPPTCSSLQQFLIDNPFIGFSEDNEMVGFIFVDKKTFTDALSNLLEKRFQTLGVNELRFIKL